MRFCSDRIWGAAALALAGSWSPPALAIDRNSDDPESVDVLSTLVPVYTQLAKLGLYARPGADAGWINGKPNYDLVTDDVCGCHYLQDGHVINPDQCAPIGASGSEDLARVGIVRVLVYERLRAGILPGTGSEAARLKALSPVNRSRAEANLRAILRDPHLAFLSPLPVADRTRHLDIGRVEQERARWPGCAIRIGERGFTPPPALNGFVARAMLYAAERYAITVDYTLGELKRLSDADPPSRWELERDILIAKIARTYGVNPFIHPALATKR